MLAGTLAAQADNTEIDRAHRYAWGEDVGRLNLSGSSPGIPGGDTPVLRSSDFAFLSRNHPSPPRGDPAHGLWGPFIPEGHNLQVLVPCPESEKLL